MSGSEIARVVVVGAIIGVLGNLLTAVLKRVMKRAPRRSTTKDFLLKRLYERMGARSKPPKDQAEQHELHKSTRPPPSNVPELPPHFLPRPEDMDRVKKLLLADAKKQVAITGTTGDVRRIGVHGMGGIGKSVLAAAVAHDEEIRDAFADGVVWLTISQTPNITHRQSQLASALGDTPPPFKDEQEERAHLSELLTDKNCLIVLDDVWEVEHAAPFNVLGERCRMLITTREVRVVRSLGAAEHELNLLTDSEAMRLLAESAGEDVKKLPDEAREVARECHNLPLALAMIGAMVRDRRNRQDRREGALTPEAALETFWEPEGLNRYDAQDVMERLVGLSLARSDPPAISPCTTSSSTMCGSRPATCLPYTADF